MTPSCRYLSQAIQILSGAIMASSVVFAEARAHEAESGQQYSWACCAKIHCKPVPDSAIGEERGGYRIKQTGELVPYSDKRIHDSEDGGFHWCANPEGLDANRTICLYRAPRGS